MSALRGHSPPVIPPSPPMSGTFTEMMKIRVMEDLKEFFIRNEKSPISNSFLSRECCSSQQSNIENKVFSA